jgi:hypothetical protein
VDSPPLVRLFYTVGSPGEALDYRVGLVTTRPQFGGLRWWFVCPLVVNGLPCGGRVAKLYLCGRYFGCRRCHGLTYTSCQEHDKRVDAFLRNPEAIDAILDNPAAASTGSLLLAIKAERKALKNLERGRLPG